MKKLFWLTLAYFGFWIPCKRFMPPKELYDWVLISWYENGLTYRYLPKIAEYSYKSNKWHSEDEIDENFLNSCNITHWRRIPEFRHLKINSCNMTKEEAKDILKICKKLRRR